MSGRHHPNVETLLSGETLPELVPLDEHWKLAREAQAKRQQDAWERSQAQWFKSVPPLYNDPEPETEILTPGHKRVLFGMCAALAVCVAVAVVALNYFR